MPAIIDTCVSSSSLFCAYADAVNFSMMSILISRFLLSLRDDYTSSKASEVQSSRYAADIQGSSRSGQLIGNLGASLRLSGDDEDEAVCMETYDKSDVYPSTAFGE